VDAVVEGKGTVELHAAGLKLRVHEGKQRLGARGGAQGGTAKEVEEERQRRRDKEGTTTRKEAGGSNGKIEVRCGGGCYRCCCALRHAYKVPTLSVVVGTARNIVGIVFADGDRRHLVVDLGGRRYRIYGSRHRFSRRQSVQFSRQHRFGRRHT
jgi:hypothetical protein